jgi:hypothetical protein
MKCSPKFAVLLCCLVLPPLFAEESSENLQEAVTGIVSQVETLRRQKFTHPPRIERAPAALRKIAADSRASQVLDPDQLAARGRAWSDIGLGGPASPANLLVFLAGGLGGVGFDAGNRRLFLSPDVLTDDDYSPSEGGLNDASTILMATGVRRDEPLVSHALMHLRQYERSGGDFLEATTDRLLASAAWAEGEANLVAVRYMLEGMGVENDVLASDLVLGDFLEGALVPAGLHGLSAAEFGLADFVFSEGFALAAHAYSSGGWAKLDGVMSRQKTTRDLLHPDRMVVSGTISAEPQPPIDGLVLIDEDRLGEQAIVTLVATMTGKDNLGLIAGDGWVDDRLIRWERQGEPATSGATEWVTLWASEAEATDFQYAYDRVLTARFPDIAADNEVAGRLELKTPGKTFSLTRQGRNVRILIIPDQTVGVHAGLD